VVLPRPAAVGRLAPFAVLHFEPVRFRLTFRRLDKVLEESTALINTKRRRTKLPNNQMGRENRDPYLGKRIIMYEISNIKLLEIRSSNSKKYM
jgi:hypothetical protein